MFWFSLQLLSELFLILTKCERNIIMNVHSSSSKVGIFVGYKEYWIFWTEFRKKSSNINFYENPSSRTELFHAEGRTGRQTWRSQTSLFTVLLMHQTKISHGCPIVSLYLTTNYLNKFGYFSKICFHILKCTASILVFRDVTLSSG